MVRSVRVPKGVAVAAVAAAAAAASVAGCRGSVHLSPDDSAQVLGRQTLEAPDPAAPGPETVRTLYYGSGTDRQRAEYRDSVSLVTGPVDASELIDLGEQANSRNRYWGFSPDSFPINGRVWYPESGGPHPLVLIVHGNHDPTDFSDPGYDYLGELLASRGMILASIDMNFVNGGIRQENDARGWLLLKHVEAWTRFNEDPESPFQGRVDLDRIALIGHSRGGEAVGHAAAFNRLSHYPDDASVRFDFGYGIRAIIALAPVDGQYRPTDRHVPLEDVNYLVLHGSHDGDVSSFHGMRLYNRIRYTGDRWGLKSAVYVYRANHGQFNTGWGAHDNGPRSARILDLRALLDPADQRRVAEVFLSAFLEVTLRDDHRYLPLFRDHRVAGEWLPRTMYFTSFQDSSYRPIAGFEEDIDVTTGAREGIAIEAVGFARWREAELRLRSQNRPTTSNSQDSYGVWLQWDGPDGGDEETPPSDTIPTYSITLAEVVVSGLALGAGSTLELRLAPTDHGSDGEDDAGPPPRVRVEVEDAHGRTGSVDLADYGPVRRPLEMRVLRRSDQEAERYPQAYDLVPQGFSIPLADFAGTEGSSRFDPASLRRISFVFDRGTPGEVVLDDIGIANLVPAFFGAERP